MCCAERRRRRFPLETRAARTPEAAALIAAAGPGRTDALTFRELERRTAAIAGRLRARGVARGAMIALRLPQEASSVELLLATLRAGAVAVPVSTRLPDAAVPALLRRVGCARIVDGNAGATDVAQRLEVVPAAELLAPSDAAAPAAPGRIAFDRAADATIVLTSGSTGVAKAAVHAFEAHWASALGSNRNVRLRPGHRWLLSLPLWHVGGLAVIFRCLCGGAAIVVPDRRLPLAESVLGLGVTHVSLVAAQLVRLLRDRRGRDALRSLECVLLGGGPAPDALVDEAARAGVRLVTSYGSTETCSQATATAPGDAPEALRTAGRPLAFREISIAADGEILARGRTLFRGYVDGGALSPARDAAEWYHSGDLGRFDAAGRLVVSGRRDAMFISGGENIHPEEIEREILGFPGLLDAVVVPVADEEFGARPAAFLRTADGTMPDPAALGAFLRRTLPGFKVPVRYLAWPDLPEGMKPDRRALAALAAARPHLADAR